MVYVIAKSGKPLMPTKNHGKVRILLREKRAKIVNNKPFTIRLLYDTTEYTQPIILGIDPGYKHIGFSAVAEKEELIAGEVELLDGVKERLKKRAMYRRNRRQRLRHRKPRFKNRKRKKGWLAPSIQHKLDSHVRFVDKIKKILPITKVIVEVNNFDTHKLKKPDIAGKDYQEGEQQGFYNLRDYIFHRDNHICQVCGGEGLILQVHHVGFWKQDRSNRPQNLIAVCVKCHSTKNHQEDGKLWGLEPENKGFKAATFMASIRWKIANYLEAVRTYGYLTKSKRIELGLEKSHSNDAFVIAGGTNQARIEKINYKQIRRNNRSLEKFYDAKYIDIRNSKKVSGKDICSGRTTRNKNKSGKNLRVYRAHKMSKGRRSIRTQRYFYQPNDLVKHNGKIYTVKGTHNKGSRAILKENEKSVKIEDLTPYMFKQSFCLV